MTTGNDIRTLRRDLGWQIDDLAAYWGVNRSTVGHWEARGDKQLPRHQLMALLLSELRRSKGRPRYACQVHSVTGDDMRQAAESLGLSPAALAEKIGVSPSQFMRYLRNGHLAPPSSRRFAIALSELRRSRSRSAKAAAAS